MGSGYWFQLPDGDYVPIPQIVMVGVGTKPDGSAEVRAWISDGGYQVLFEHPAHEVCEEWLQEFLRRTGGVVAPIRLRRTCPTCTGVGRVGQGTICADCDGEGTALVDPAEIPAEEVEQTWSS